MSVELFNLLKPTEKNAGGGGGIKSEIILIHEADIDWDLFPERDPDGVTISDSIFLLAGKFMYSFYMTQGTIKPSQKKLKGSNQDCGGYEIALEGFYPGIEKAVQQWIANFGIDFKGLVIIQNCASAKRYLIGEPCNLVHLETIDTAWGEEIDKDKGSKFGFLCKQGSPMAFYEGEMQVMPNIPVPPIAGTHVASTTQIIWNWSHVNDATGYKWSATNNFANATSMGNVVTKTETGLTANTGYIRFVWAQNAAGNSTALILTKSTLAV